MRFVQYISALSLCAGLAFGAAIAAPVDRLSEREILRAALAASKSPEDRIGPLIDQLQASIDAVAARFPNGKSNYRRARRLHQLLHRGYLLAYDSDADGLQEIAAGGRYNCLSATLFYGLVARRLGFPTDVLASPGHLSLRLQAGQRVIHVETTTPQGFDSHRYETHGSSGSVRGNSGLQPVGPERYEQSGSRYWRVSLEEAVGFAWLNRAWRELDRDARVEAAESVRTAGRYLTEMAVRADGARLVLARAFHQEYDLGNFDAAFRIAIIDVTLFPGLTTSRDRALAAALRRVEEACDRDRPVLALAVIERLDETLTIGADLDHLERQVFPQIVTAAVRSELWQLARHAAERYALVQPDLTESYRLLDWVEWRASQADQSEPICEDRVMTPWLLIGSF